MSPGQAEALELEFLADDSRAGFRLQRLEVLNWGTFDGRPWTVELNGRNTLLTGDIGSGKSTLVDAVTTLLIPSNRVAYNKAAGADARERSLRTYLHGHYKAERSELTGGSKPVALRDHTAYSVLLGVFHNEGYDKTVTLAQVFWTPSPTERPSRMYVAMESERSIAEDFTGFGSEMRALRKRLRSSGAEVWDSFPPYGSWFRRRFGIAGSQALDLFHQTVSMKSVGNLTDFVRQHMLPEFDVGARIDALIDHFNDLNRAHEAVLKAKHQVSLLTPIVADADLHATESSQVDDLRSCRDALGAAMDVQRLEILVRELDTLEERRRKQEVRIHNLEERRTSTRAELDDVRRSITENGGGRFEFLASQIATRSRERDQRKARFDQLAEYLGRLGMPMPSSGDAFVALRSAVEGQLASLNDAETDSQIRVTDLEVELRRRRAEEAELAAEIANLERRPTNIPVGQVGLRQELAEGTGIAVDALPFAGELIEVDEDETRWEGAIERVLHNFGLSLLVADEHYATVAGWVDRTHLRGRLVYFRVRDDDRNTAVHHREIDVDSLINKVNVKPSSRFHDWVGDELTRRFDYVCCDDQDRFRRERFALTAAGQIKAGGRRHEKDDRHRVDDRRRFVLGWSNTAKLATLVGDRRTLQTTIAEVAGRLAAVQDEMRDLRVRRNDLAAVNHFREFAEVDWATVAREIEGYEDERRALEASSDVLARLRSRQAELEAALEAVEGKLADAYDARSRLSQRIDDRREQHDGVVGAIKEPSFTTHEPWFDQLAAIQTEVVGNDPLTLTTIEQAEREVREWLQAEIDRVDKSLGRLAERVVRQMAAYCEHYPVETQEVTPSLESADEFRSMLLELHTDGLPGFEARFKEQLNVNTIREIVNFQSQLHRERDHIGERIAHINKSLTKIDYNPGRYIALLADRSRDQEVAAFLQDLRACSEETLTGSDDDHYSEAKFLQVKAILERLSGRPGQSELDKRWAAKVTDVRNWFVFNASERWREDDVEHEHYSDSSGKSGGQKEKLAYTILAASLAYQFGLEWGEARSKTFRFVVIDEAFGRGSDESAHYGLRLFKELNLQLLIVTPLQKIHVIEPFVSGVGYITNEDGRSSKIRNLTIEEYRAEKAERDRR